MRKKILCIDDDEGTLAALSTLLRVKGFDVLTAQMNERALRLLERHGDEISLVISDINRRVGCGVRAKELKALGIRESQGGLWFFVTYLQAEAHRRPCLFVSGNAREEITWLWGTPGVYRLEKPFSAKELVELVETALREASESESSP